MRSADASDFGAQRSDGPLFRSWLAARDAVLRGLVHAFSNRVGTVIAVGGMLDAGSAELAGRVLVGEADRLETLLTHFRLVTADPFASEVAPEPVILAEVIAESIALRAYASDGDGTAVTAVGVDDAPPVIVSRTGLVHACLVLLTAAYDHARVLRVDVVPTGEVRVRLEPGVGADVLGVAAWLLASSNVQAGPDGILLPRFGAMPGV